MTVLGLGADVDLIRNFTEEQLRRGLESWEWIGVSAKTPLFTSPFGDVIFRADDGFWWLDTLEGSLTRPWTTGEALKADLNTTEGQDRYLLAGLGLGAERRGLTPTPSQVYGFKIPPILGGKVDMENVEVIDFVVGLNIAGQIHEQVQALPSGTPISRITLS
ncbi:T6SS immunity protein Tdi1 domain-containing protein [Micromonospora sp. DT47]|uniref:T6SS immunity protein Tdi1 domain-containing protein n=1 Tax=Micromonospora sp. DT47 TaxID=3393431 RepID=UPI003CE76202